MRTTGAEYLARMQRVGHCLRVVESGVRLRIVVAGRCGTSLLMAHYHLIRVVAH